MKDSKKDEKFFCHDCKEEIKIKDKEIQNGKLVEYHDKVVNKKIRVFKCNDCYKKYPALRNFRECEVYSRIVGYIRPIKQWHPGKTQEFEERKVFKID